MQNNLSLFKPQLSTKALMNPYGSLSKLAKSFEQGVQTSHDQRPKVVILSLAELQGSEPWAKVEDEALKFEKLAECLKNENKLNVLNVDYLQVGDGLVNKMHQLIKSLNLKNKESLELHLFFVGHGGASWFFSSEENCIRHQVSLKKCNTILKKHDLPKAILDLKQVTLIRDALGLHIYHPKKQELNLFNLLPEDLQQFDKQFTRFTRLAILDDEQLEQLEAWFSGLPLEPLALLNRVKYENLPEDAVQGFVDEEMSKMVYVAHQLQHLEVNLGIKIASIFLFSCHSAAEFFNPEEYHYSLSPARLMSQLLPHTHVVGFLGNNADYKLTKLFRVSAPTEMVSVNLIEGLMVFQNMQLKYAAKSHFGYELQGMYEYILANVFPTLLSFYPLVDSLSLLHTLPSYIQEGLVYMDHCFGRMQQNTLNTKVSEALSHRTSLATG